MSAGAAFKIFCVVLYAGVVGGFVLYAMRHTPGPQAILTRAVKANDQIQASDIAPLDGDKIVGRFARDDHKAGDEITAHDVSVLRPPPPAPRLDLILPFAQAPGARALAVGDSVQLCLDGKTVAAKIAVEASTCDDRICLLTLPVAGDQTTLVQAAANPRLRATAVGSPCGGG